MRTLQLCCAIVVVALTHAPRGARACSPALPPPPAAIPVPNSSGVSPMTSIIVLSAQAPANLTLTANGTDVALPAAPVALGGGPVAGGATTFWTLGLSALTASAEHVLTLDGKELTRFTTAATYDKAPGTAAVVKSLKLWRVRYPLDWIASGNCVFAEYHGFVALDWAPASMPSTEPNEMVYSLRLAPKTGGSEQELMFTGDVGFAGSAPSAPDYLPAGPFRPELDPSREYCVTLTAFGDGDLARLPVTSAAVCAMVTELDVTTDGGVPDAGPAKQGSSEDSGGCALARRDSRVRSSWLALALGLSALIRRRSGALRGRSSAPAPQGLTGRRGVDGAVRISEPPRGPHSLTAWRP